MRPFVDKLKTTAKLITPNVLHQYARELLARQWEAKYAGRSVEEIFSAIYREGKWATTSAGEFSSGSGSHTPTLVLPYVSAVAQFLEAFPSKPSVVDLGCGDFNVGKHLRPYCGRYVACDVVPALIQRNKDKFANLQVEFRCLDITEAELPDGDVVFLRQVLQHLNNAQIMRVVPRLCRYKFLVFTEHLPSAPEFTANRDKSTGGGIRLPQGSGVVLTAPPFLLKVKTESAICTISQSFGRYPGLIRTTVYELGDR